MFSQPKESPSVEDFTEDDSLGSSISLSVGENSIHIKEKPKLVKEPEPPPDNEINLEEKWWLKRPDTRLEITNAKAIEMKTKKTPTPSPDISSSMKEFLEKEKMCKIMHKSEGEVKDKDDTLCDILASVAFDKYQSDFENATDEDIGSILEEMSRIAGALSPNSAADNAKSGSSSKHHTEEEKSVEELLEEAEKLVLKNTSNLSKSISKSETLVSDNDQDNQEDLSRVRKLEEDIFQLIKEEVHKESEKIKKSPKYEKKRDTSPGIEMVYENINILRPPKTLEFQRKKFEEQKVEISSSSDLDDPIERHSRSEELKSIKKMSESKDSLQKEITDVDKDFFENLLKRSKERLEGGMSGSSSFGQEDFSHFLKLLQGQSDKKEQELKETMPIYDLFLKSTKKDGISTVEGQSITDKSPEFPEKEISEILEKELPHTHTTGIEHKTGEIELRKSKEVRQLDDRKIIDASYSIKRTHDQFILHKTDQISPKVTDTNDDNKKVVNSKNELYTVGLTPRLELFADAIPKLIAEKSNENIQKDNKVIVESDKESIIKETNTKVKTNTASSEKTSRVNSKDSYLRDWRKRVSDLPKTSRVASDNKNQKKEIRFCKSKSYDQICKPQLKNSQENIKVPKSADITRKANPLITKKSPILKSKIQSKPVSKFLPKSKMLSQSKGDIEKAGSTLSLPCRSSQFRSSPENPMAGGDTKQNVIKKDWEASCREEKHKNILLKQQLESEVKLYKSQIDNMRISFEEELFALRKENIILKAKIDELSLNEKHGNVHSKSDAKVIVLEQEIEKLENVIRTYEAENKKLIQDTKRMQEEIKKLQQKQKSTTLETNEMQRLIDRIKDLEEEALKLNLEVSELKEKNADCTLKNDDLIQQNGLLNDELEMFKEQFRAKNDFITDRLQAMTKVEVDLKKQVEELNIKLSSKNDQLRTTKSEFEKLQQKVLPLERELLEFRVKEGNLQEKLQTAKNHVEREKQLTQKLKDQVILDNKKIMDLTRQVREMERILKRKNPDSVSALILTANSEQDKIGTEKVKLLEERIAVLEKEIETKEDISQQKLFDLQQKFSDMKEKYISQITELEGKLLEATVANQKVYNDMFTQTTFKTNESKGVETYKKDERSLSIDKEERKDQRIVKVGPKSQNPKEDAHLIATIRGLKLELSNKDRAVSKLTKEYQELQKTNRRLQKEREKLLNDRRTFKSADLEKANAKLLVSRSTEGNDQNSNIYQNGHVADQGSRLTASTHKLYDPMHYTETTDNALIKKLLNDNEILKEELSKINKDFMALKNKRLHDLNLLQEEHEREMATLVKEYSVKFGDSKVVKLQGQVNTQVAVITHLKEQIDKLRDYKEQVVVLKAEREHLENKVKTLNEKVKYLSTPGTEQLQLLQDKITILQQRHESREMTLQSLVRNLLRNRTQCKDCKNEKGKNRQLCYFRQELDHILAMLQEIANSH
ncbi:centrosomal protein of 162 kDa-like isoform X1 [Vespa velutina]|uniref:centrosomal protein of 162 kDa-like isoform X1 n=1 Tax=Vespa velutina TaxID=202808 RepID=UPI001FB2C33A|nr:centrosomal protein of 162 kDa-like isoform X1 [Vespa velutina]